MMLGMATDITENKLAEESETRFFAMLSSLVEGVCYFDLNGRLEYLNPAARIMLNCDAELNCGRNVHELVHGSGSESAGHSAASPCSGTDTRLVTLLPGGSSSISSSA